MLVALLAGAYMFSRGRQVLPAQGTPAYEQVSTAFFRGLAAMQVGLLDDARQAFARATEAVPAEPAGWANLGIAYLRLGELDAAASPIGQAAALAPQNADVALLAGRMEIARGRIDEGIAHLQRAVMLNPQAVRARYALAQEIERSGRSDADAEAQRLLEGILQVAPANIAVLLERARIAVKRGDVATLRDSVSRLEARASAWPAAVRDQYASLQAAAAAGNLPDAARSTAVLRNVLARVADYRDSLSEVSTATELIADPFERFLVLEQPAATPAPPDRAVSFTAEAIAGPAPAGAAPAVTLAAFADDERAPLSVFLGDGTTLSRAGDPSSRVGGGDAQGAAAALLPIDWNHDFKTDLVAVGRSGVRLLRQDDAGEFSDLTPRNAPAIGCDCVAAWAADIEMDGDVDIVLGQESGPTLVLRNNGDGGWQPLQTFAAVAAARGFAWADFDGDGDPDAALLDASGRVHVLLNRQAGDFAEIAGPAATATVTALAAGDVNGDGALDVVTIDRAGALRRASLPRSDDTDGTQSAAAAGARRWDEQPLAPAVGDAGGATRLILADLDNNGALDIVAATGGRSRVWLADERFAFAAQPAAIDADVFSVADVTADGRVDLVGLSAGRPVRLINRGERSYHWKSLRARAQQSAGDQRINSFGVGGEVEIRSGLLVQKQVLNGAPVHFGLGTRTAVDVVRIIWPNGVPQAEFDVPIDNTVVAEQRLKGSCPWVFADNGHGPQFVTDFLWRSPLGLRINAQDTAGTSQTEDWVKIAGEQLLPVNGHYDVRITAELWETHFFDHVSLLVVDHPADSEVYVDERFSAMHPPSLAVHAVTATQPVTGAWDDAGRNVTELVARRDGRYLASFPRGAYQGIAADHAVEFELAAPVPAGVGATLLASGWVYPTDSSINVAIAQGQTVRPSGLSLEAQDAAGAWRMVNADVGFPAGKNKTMLIDLGAAAGARRLRLRTNLEIYWDALAYTQSTAAPVKTTRLAASAADLRFRGFSQTTSPRGDAPETPRYDRPVSTSQRWRDLVGYYTRFGDVKELLAGVDDRYVIMNAGDEMRLLFDAMPAPAAGWRRDFVLIGDGWEKDGDYNTGYSKTVLPLPTHARSAYQAQASSLELEADPVYKAHSEDWQRYHTRFVTPDAFLRGLR